MPVDKAWLINTAFLQTALWQRIGLVWDRDSRTISSGDVCCCANQQYRFDQYFCC